MLIFGITAISSYSILFIRNYLLDEGRNEMRKDTRWMAVTIENISEGAQFDHYFEEAASIAGYQLVLYDEEGAFVTAYPDSLAERADPFLPAGLMSTLRARNELPLIPDQPDSEKLTGYMHLNESSNAVRFIRVEQYKDRIYAPIKTIRWIIYYGMFISIGLVILVSIWIARYVTRPITQIKDAATQIAEGDVDRQIDLERGDEFGTLAQSLNQMASKLRADTEQIKSYAEKQRQFFADITHEIRNPLHAISGALEMLELENISEEKKKNYLATARKQTDRIHHLFKDLVTLQRYDSDERFIEKKTFDLAVIGEHMIDWYADRAKEKGIELVVDTHTCEAEGDPGKIEQVIDNLIYNAIKYTNEGKVTLSYASTDGEVVIEVKDTGIGISEKHLGRLFDRFYRTDKARSRDKGGTGLGLAVVKSILDAHGSQIEVESEQGRGTSFWFTLPGG